MPILETISPCPCCGADSTHYHDTEGHVPDEIACGFCSFQWQRSRCSMWPDGDAEQHRAMIASIEWREEYWEGQ